jgi:molybdopterin molybdotransferase
MLSVEEVLGRLLAVVAPLPAERVALSDAVGRVLAEPVRSALDLPPWDNSAMDGYAVHAVDTAGALAGSPARLRVVGEVRAGGSADIDVPPGCAVRIATGAPVPASTDAVVPVESTLDISDAAGGTVATPGKASSGFASGSPPAAACLVIGPARPGDHVRHRGEDVRAATEVLAAGSLLGPAQVALTAAVGAATVSVHRRPVVAVLSTGDELRAPGSDLGGSGIPDSNRPGLLAACTVAGAATVDLGIARDTLESVLGAIRPALDNVDAVIVSGGVSVGPYDVVRTAFESIGSVDLWRVAIQPGKPFAFGRSNPRGAEGHRVPLFGLPGNPVSTLVTFELFVRPVIRRLAGGPAGAGTSDRAVARERLRSAPGRRGFLRIRVERGQDGSPLRDAHGRLTVSLAGGQGSHVLSAMAAADALAIVPENVGVIEPGSEVEIMWLDR